MPGRSRGVVAHDRARSQPLLVVLALVLVVVAGLIVADVVTLTKAKPSFDKETRGLSKL